MAEVCARVDIVDAEDTKVSTTEPDGKHDSYGGGNNEEEEGGKSKSMVGDGPRERGWAGIGGNPDWREAQAAPEIDLRQ